MDTKKILICKQKRQETMDILSSVKVFQIMGYPTASFENDSRINRNIKRLFITLFYGFEFCIASLCFFYNSWNFYENYFEGNLISVRILSLAISKILEFLACLVALMEGFLAGRDQQFLEDKLGEVDQILREHFSYNPNFRKFKLNIIFKPFLNFTLIFLCNLVSILTDWESDRVLIIITSLIIIYLPFLYKTKFSLHMKILEFYLRNIYEIIDKAIKDQPKGIDNRHIYKTALTHEQIQILRKVYTLLWESLKLNEGNFHNTLVIEFGCIIYESVYIGYYILEGMDVGTIYLFIYFEVVVFILRVILIIPVCQNCINLVNLTVILMKLFMKISHQFSDITVSIHRLKNVCKVSKKKENAISLFPLQLSLQPFEVNVKGIFPINYRSLVNV